jgi:hypothetical protein
MVQATDNWDKLQTVYINAIYVCILDSWDQF